MSLLLYRMASLTDAEIVDLEERYAKMLCFRHCEATSKQAILEKVATLSERRSAAAVRQLLGGLT